MGHFSSEELSRYDGLEGRPAYVAVAGKVYDVTGSFLWKAGRHQVFHEAGKDLTAGLTEAPHGDDLLERVPCIGVLDPSP